MSITTTKQPTGQEPPRSPWEVKGLQAGGRRASSSMRGARHRSWGLVTLAALLVLGCGLAVAAWGLHAGQKESVIAIGSPVAKGQVIERADLTTVSVAGVADTFGASAVDRVVGMTATVDLVEGQIVSSALLTSDLVPGKGEALVGLSLDPSRVPGDGLDVGDPVEVIAVPAANDAGASGRQDSPELLSPSATVYAVKGAVNAGGQVLVTLVVASGEASKIALYSTQNRVAVVETSPAGGS